MGWVKAPHAGIVCRPVRVRVCVRSSMFVFVCVCACVRVCVCVCMCVRVRAYDMRASLASPDFAVNLHFPLGPHSCW